MDRKTFFGTVAGALGLAGLAAAKPNPIEANGVDLSPCLKEAYENADLTQWIDKPTEPAYMAMAEGVDLRPFVQETDWEYIVNGLIENPDIETEIYTKAAKHYLRLRYKHSPHIQYEMEIKPTL